MNTKKINQPTTSNGVQPLLYQRRETDEGTEVAWIMRDGEEIQLPAASRTRKTKDGNSDE
jgi:hypothetical protein